MKHKIAATLACSLLTLTAVRAEDKPAAAAPAAAAPAAPAAAAPAGELHKEMLGVLPGVMQYDKKELTAKAGEKMAILFKNAACPLQHNFLLCKPGTDAAIGKLSDEMLQKDAAGALAKAYVPESPDIVVAGKKLLGPGQSEIIQFTVPDVAGDYPYVCTFPGHRFLMKGVLKVTK